MNLFSRRELRDLAIAWIALAVAFTMFLGRPAILEVPEVALVLFAICLVTAGVGFLAHELAHKFVAMHFDRPAAFHAEYGLLALTVLSGIGGFLFAAPGAVHHRGRRDPREIGLVAVAGPVVNLALVLAFLPLYLAPIGAVATLGAFGLWINALLAAFNMLPFGPLDGKTVIQWRKDVFALVFIPAVAAAALTFATVGLLPV